MLIHCYQALLHSWHRAKKYICIYPPPLKKIVFFSLNNMYLCTSSGDGECEWVMESKYVLAVGQWELAEQAAFLHHIC